MLIAFAAFILAWELIDIVEEEIMKAELPVAIEILLFLVGMWIWMRLDDWLTPGLDNIFLLLVAEEENPAATLIRKLSNKKHLVLPPINSQSDYRRAKKKFQ